MFEFDVYTSDLTLHLKNENCINNDQAKEIKAFLQKETHVDEVPQSARKLSGCGAWIATIFFISFFVVSLQIAGFTLSLIGIALMAGSIMLQRQHKGNMFIEQLTLSWMFTGNFLLLMGFNSRYFHLDIFSMLIIQMIICIVTYPLFESYVYRYCSPLSVVLMAMSWIYSIIGNAKTMVFFHLLVLILTLATGFLILDRKRKKILDPLAYTMANSLPLVLIIHNTWRSISFSHKFKSFLLWPSSIILSLALIYLIANIAGGYERLKEPRLFGITISIVILGLFTNPGILVAIGLMILGYELDDRYLTSTAYLFLTAFLFFFYYDLKVSLAYKSWIVVGSGLILLLLRQALEKLKPAGEIPS